jgi:hypothetical protein
MQIHRKIYRKTIFAMLGATKVISSTDKTLPGKWHSVIDSLRASSQAIHAQLTVLDEDLAGEYYELEDEIGKRIGKRKLYSKDDIDLAKSRIESVEFRPPS